MRVLHTFKLYRPAEGGVISVMRDLIEAAPEDVESRVLACRRTGPARETIGRADVRRCLAPFEMMSLPLAPTYPFRHFAMARHCDLVASHSPFPLGELAGVIAGRWMPPYVVHWHSEVIAQRRTAALLGPLTRRYLERAAAVLVSTPGHIDVSPWLREFREKCHVVPFGIDPGHKSEPRRPRNLPKQWPEAFGLFVGRLVPYKGLSVLLKAAAESDLPLVIAGSGPLADELQAEIAQRGLAARVLLLGGVDENEKSWLLQKARFLVLPSTGANETFGIVQLEAMAAGLPIVNTDAHPGIGWVARDGREAITVTSGDAGGLANAMRTLIRDEGRAKAMGQAGRDRLSRNFTFEKFVGNVFDIYNDVLKNS